MDRADERRRYPRLPRHRLVAGPVRLAVPGEPVRVGLLVRRHGVPRVFHLFFVLLIKGLAVLLALLARLARPPPRARPRPRRGALRPCPCPCHTPSPLLRSAVHGAAPECL